MSLVGCRQMGWKFLHRYPARPLWGLFASQSVFLSSDVSAFRKIQRGKLKEREESLSELVRRASRVDDALYNMRAHDEPYETPLNNFAAEISHEEEASINRLQQQNVYVSVEYVQRCREEVKLLRNREIIIQEIRGLNKFDSIAPKVFKEFDQVSTDEIRCRFEEMRNASQYFELLEYLVENLKIGHPVHSEWPELNHTSSSGEIWNILQKLWDKFPMLKLYYLHHGLNEHIVRLRCLHMVNLIYRLCLFLPSCKFLEPRSSTSCEEYHFVRSVADDVELLKQTEDFKRDFHELPDVYIEKAVQDYRKFLLSTNRASDEWRSVYKEDMKAYLKSRRNYHLEVKNPFADRVFEMVLQTRKESWDFDKYGEAYSEVPKIEKFFEVIEDSQQQIKSWKKILMISTANKKLEEDFDDLK